MNVFYITFVGFVLHGVWKFKISSEASYVYILSGQKFIQNAKNTFWRVFDNLKLPIKQCYQTEWSFIGQKLVENGKIQRQHFWQFSNWIASNFDFWDIFIQFRTVWIHFQSFRKVSKDQLLIHLVPRKKMWHFSKYWIKCFPTLSRCPCAFLTVL